MSAPDPALLRDWTPVRTLFEPRREAVLWTRFGERAFDAPFFQQTISAHFEADPGARVLATPLEVLDGLERHLEVAGPTGFVFHTSRCGSTLLANALRGLDDTLVVSEPPPLNELLFLPFRSLAGPAHRVRWVRGMIAALAQPRGHRARRCFFKFTSTNVRLHAVVREAFPEVPCLFLCRHPVEVLVSFLADPPGWVAVKAEPAAAEAMLRMPGAALGEVSDAEFAARVLGGFYESGLEVARHGAVLDYEQLQPGAMADVVRVFGVEATQGERRRMAAAFGHHSKLGPAGPAFRADAGAKRRAADETVQRLAGEWSMDPYRRLRAARIASLPAAR